VTPINRWSVIAAALSILSVGWLVPLFLAASFYLAGFEILIRGRDSANSFPYFQAGWDALRLGSAWCSLSALVWATYGINRLLQRSRVRGSAQRFRETVKK
jgi:hypothetical protein